MLASWQSSRLLPPSAQFKSTGAMTAQVGPWLAEEQVSGAASHLARWWGSL